MELSETKGKRVTVEDLETGEIESMTIIDDYILITTGSCYPDSVTVHSNGTHQIVIKGVKKAVSDDMPPA